MCLPHSVAFFLKHDRASYFYLSLVTFYFTLKLLKDLKETNRARIIICDIHDHLLMKPILCMASKLKVSNLMTFYFLLCDVNSKMSSPHLLLKNTSCFFPQQELHNLNLICNLNVNFREMTVTLVYLPS